MKTNRPTFRSDEYADDSPDISAQKPFKGSDALFDPKSLQDNAFSAEFLDMAVVFAIVDTSNPYRIRLNF